MVDKHCTDCSKKISSKPTAKRCLSCAKKGNTYGFKKGIALRKGVVLSEETKRKISDGKSGVPHSEEHKKKLSDASLGKPRKEKVTYNGIHKWITARLGRPKSCRFCLKTDLGHRQYHWANISDLYKRDLDDWVRLCVKCHMLYDKNKRIIKQQINK